MGQATTAEITTDWVRYSTVREVPVGPALDYLTLLALHFGQHIRAVTGLSKGSCLDMIHECPEPFDECSIKAIKGIYDIEMSQTVDGSAHRATCGMFTSECDNAVEAVKRVLCMNRLAGMVLNVPTNLPDPAYDKWINSLLETQAIRSGAGGKSQTIMLHILRQAGGRDRIAYEEVQRQEHYGNPQPADYVERLRLAVEAGNEAYRMVLSTPQNPNSELSVSLRASQPPRYNVVDMDYLDASQHERKECLMCDAGIPYSHTPTLRRRDYQPEFHELPRDVLVIGGSPYGRSYAREQVSAHLSAERRHTPVKIGIVGADGTGDVVRRLIEGLGDGYEVQFIDSCPDGFREVRGFTGTLDRLERMSIMESTELPWPERKAVKGALMLDGDRYHNWRSRYPTDPYHPARHAEKKKAKRKQARAQRKANNRSKK